MTLWSKSKYFMSQGIRKFAALVNSLKGGKGSATAKLSRTHVIEFSDSGLCSLLGGKWTSFRHMGQECVEEILERNPELQPCKDKTQTLDFNLIGSYSKQEALSGMKPSDDELLKQYENHFMSELKLPKDVTKHLLHTYGTTALRVVSLGSNERILEGYPFIRSEIEYAIQNEMAVKPNDVLCRRIPIAFLDQKAAESLLPEVVDILGAQR